MAEVVEEQLNAENERRVDREPPSDDERDRDFDPSQVQETQSDSDVEPPRPKPRQPKRKKPASRKQPRKKLRRSQGIMNQSRQGYTEQRLQDAYPHLEANAEVARENLLVDTEEVPLPPRHLLREVLYKVDSRELHFDSTASTFFTCGARLFNHLQNSPELTGFIIRYYRNQQPKQSYVHPLCGHLVKTPDPHVLCRQCQYIAVNLLCYKTTDCQQCAQTSEAVREQRRDRNSRQNKALPLKTLGGRYEARHLLPRMLYLEGVLWCLAGFYEQRTNVEALKRCRRAVRLLLKLQAPEAMCKPLPPLAGDYDLPEDTPYSPLPAITGDQMLRRSARVVKTPREAPHAALARLAALADATPATTDARQPVPKSINLQPMEYFVDDSAFDKSYPGLLKHKQNGYYSMRLESKIREFRVRVNPLSSIEQRRMKLKRLGLDPDMPFTPHKPKSGVPPTSKQRLANLRNKARKSDGMSAPGSGSSGTPTARTNEQMYPVPVSRADIQGSEAELFASSSEYEELVERAQKSAENADGAAAGASTSNRGENTSEESDGDMEADDEDQDESVDPADSEQQSVTHGSEPHRLTPFKEVANEVLAKRAGSTQPRASARLAEKRRKLVLESHEGVEIIKSRENACVMKGGRVFKTRHGWRKLRFLEYRVKLILNRAWRCAPEYDKYRYQFRKKPPAPFLLYKAELIFQHLCRAQEAQRTECERQHKVFRRMCDETEQALREERGITALTIPEQTNIETLAVIKASYALFTARRVAEVAFDLDEAARCAGDTVNPTVRLTPLQQDQVDQLDADDTFPVGCDAGQLSRFISRTRETSPTEVIAKTGVREASKETRSLTLPIIESSGSVFPNAYLINRPTQSLDQAGSASIKAGAQRRKTSPVKRKTNLLLVKMSPEQQEKFSGGSTPSPERRAAVARELLTSSMSKEAQEPLRTEGDENQRQSSPRPTATVEESEARPIIEPVSDEESTHGKDQKIGQESAPVIEAAEETAASSEMQPQQSTVDEIAQSAGAPDEAGCSNSFPAVEPEDATPVPSTLKDTDASSSQPVMQKASTESENSEVTKSTGEAQHEDRAADANPDVDAGAANEEENMESENTDGRERDAAPSLETLERRKAATDAKLGRITEGEWQQLCRYFEIEEDVQHRAPFMMELLYKLAHALQTTTATMNRHAVRAIVAIDKVVNLKEGEDLPSQTEQYQLAALLEKFHRRFPKCRKEDMGPWEELTVFYADAREDLEQEVAQLLEVIEPALPSETAETEEDGAVQPTTALGRVFKKVDELVEEYKTVQKARRNARMEIHSYREKSQESERQLTTVREDLQRQNTNAERLQAQVLAKNTLVNELETRAAREDEARKQAAQNQTRQLNEQRVYYAEQLQKETDARKQIEEELRSERMKRIQAEKNLEKATAAYKEDLEERPANDREVRAIREHLKEVYETRENLRQDMLKMSVDLRRCQAEVACMSSASRQGARLIHRAARNPYASSTAGQSSVLTSAAGGSQASAPSISPPGFDENLARMRAEALYVSSTSAPSNIIPEDLLDVEPMPVGNVHYNVPFWDLYVFK